MTNHVASCGQMKVARLAQEPHGTHSESVLSFIRSGSLDMLHGETFTATQGMFVLVPGGMPHTLLSGSDLHVHWMSFCPDCLGLTADSALLQPFSQVRLGALPALTLSAERIEFVQTLYQQFEAALQQTLPLEVMKSFVFLLLHEVSLAQQPVNWRAGMHPKVVAALSYIESQGLKPVSLQDVANAAFVSAPYLATLFKRETGYSVGQWLTKKRLGEACNRLMHTHTPIAALVEELGWSDTTHFIRQFKAAYGVTPALWRRQHNHKGEAG
ncbi:AraC family transcriptional regulator [Pseudoalteromonas sp. OOF1S-7]|uniref:helix-turn-helix domain-containing protein n=1 Tax=Pseudoalteromonas sp. OOF1S-7 TaxID=2917757 RepID=UPI001EF69542|nr:AraC family transcriptional regulator [Pseudoalteromonas sp. OOF1S-7]MCG7536902.1 AraC family transcriptional regulator [Pseudoalteromonas sp. OOF1S-7]